MRNKHPGPCYRCGKNVPAGSGYFERYASGWRVQHVECCHKAQREKAAHQPSAGQCAHRWQTGLVAPGVPDVCMDCGATRPHGADLVVTVERASSTTRESQ